MTEENDIVVRVGKGREIARITIPGAAGRVGAVNVTFLPGDNTKLQDFTIQLHDGAGPHEVEVVESQGVIGFAPNILREIQDEDDTDEDDEE